LPKKFKKITFFTCFCSKNKVFTPYSPIFKGVKIEAVCAESTCLILSKKEIFVTCFESTCHFNISKNQLLTLKNKTAITKGVWRISDSLKYIPNVFHVSE